MQTSDASSRELEFTLYFDDLRDLFVAPEPQPFSAHPNYESGVDQIFNALRRRKPRRRIRTTVHVANELNASALAETKAALGRYCQSRIDIERVVISCHRREGAAKLAIGVVFLLATLGVKAIMDQFTFEPELLHQFITEGLTVLGWVMLWAPLALLLFDWWPSRRNVDAYIAIREMDISLVGPGRATGNSPVHGPTKGVRPIQSDQGQ